MTDIQTPPRKSGPEVIRAFVRTLPAAPGVYRMLDADGEVMYVGKARNLKARVTNYTRPEGLELRLQRMIASTVSMEVVRTETESEALLLEANMIKRLKPRFNIGPVDEAEVKTAQATFRNYGAMLDAHLKSREWLVGDTLTIADFSVAVTLPYAEKAHIPLNEFPEVRRWHDQLNELDAWRNPLPQQHA